MPTCRTLAPTTRRRRRDPPRRSRGPRPRPRPEKRPRGGCGGSGGMGPGLRTPAFFFAAAVTAALGQHETLVVTATRVPQTGFDIPAAIDVVDLRGIREDKPQVNLSEALGTVP